MAGINTVIRRIACVIIGTLLGSVTIFLGCATESAPSAPSKTADRPAMAGGAAEASAHPQGWLATHGANGKDYGTACVKCHHKRQCSDCHGVKMPHPEFWFVEHWAQASWRSDSVCSRCHVGRGTCAPCHGPRPVPAEELIRP